MGQCLLLDYFRHCKDVGDIVNQFSIKLTNQAYLFEKYTYMIMQFIYECKTEMLVW